MHETHFQVNMYSYYSYCERSLTSIYTHKSVQTYLQNEFYTLYPKLTIKENSMEKYLPCANGGKEMHKHFREGLSPKITKTENHHTNAGYACNKARSVRRNAVNCTARRRRQSRRAASAGKGGRVGYADDKR